jgi:subtilisin family serine protease
VNRTLHRGRAALPALAVALVALAGCLPSPPPSIPSPVPAPTPPPTTTAKATTTTTAPPAKTCGAATASLGEAAPADAPPVGAAELADAAQSADGAPVVISAVDAAGRPSVEQVSADTTAELHDELLEVADRLTDDGHRVVAVEPDRPVAAFGAPDPFRSVQWPLERLPFEATWSRGNGGGVCVAVLDNGIQRDHPDLAGRVAAGVNETDEALGAGAAHGTHVAGVIAAIAGNGIGISGAAPGARLLDVKVLRASGSGFDSGVAAGLVWAVDHGAQVVNLSLGSTCAPLVPDPCRSVAMEHAVDYAKSHDVVVVAAAGNDGDPDSPPDNPELNWWSWPAALDWPLAVASTTVDDTRSPSSTQASYVDVAAPGDTVPSTVAGGGYAYMTGTSMAAPHVTALAALLRSVRPAETAAVIRSRILTTATDLGAPGPDEDFGRGLIAPVAAVG